MDVIAEERLWVRPVRVPSPVEEELLVFALHLVKRWRAPKPTIIHSKYIGLSHFMHDNRLYCRFTPPLEGLLLILEALTTSDSVSSGYQRRDNLKTKLPVSNIHLGHC